MSLPEFGQISPSGSAGFSPNFCSSPAPCSVLPLDNKRLSVQSAADCSTEVGQTGGSESIRKLQKLASKKAVSDALKRALIACNPGSLLFKRYQGSCLCMPFVVVETDGGTLKKRSKYCRQRWCTTCSYIAQGKRFAVLKPLISQMWLDGRRFYLVTLTRPNVVPDCVRAEWANLGGFLRKLSKNMHSQNIPYNAVWAFEATINAITRTIHPHAHGVVESLEMAQRIVAAWLKANPTAYKGAQSIDCITDLAGLMEVTKYTVKSISSTDLGSVTDPYLLDAIYQSLQGVKTYRCFGEFYNSASRLNDDKITDNDFEYLEGDLLSPEQETELQELKQLTAQKLDFDFEPGMYHFRQHDWISEDGLCLSGYVPDLKQMNIVKVLSTYTPAA